MKQQPLIVLTLVWVCTICAIPAQAANPGDIYPDNKVDWKDIMVMGDDWLFDGNTPADIDASGDVNGVDFAILANNWGWTGTPTPDGMVFVYIDDSGAGMKDEDGNPISHGGFTGYMSKYETTNAQYCQFLNAAMDAGMITVDSNIVYDINDTSHLEPYFITYAVSPHSQITYSDGTFNVRIRDSNDRSNHPVVQVTWYGATAFCNYYDYRLPTEWEWQAVADYDGSYIYGCGTTIDHSKANHNGANPLDLSATDRPFTSPVNYYPSYGYGMNDMAGNVWEWTSSCYYDMCTPDGFVVRGGSWVERDDFWCEVWIRSPYPPNGVGYGTLGFRVCR